MAAVQLAQYLAQVLQKLLLDELQSWGLQHKLLHSNYLVSGWLLLGQLIGLLLDLQLLMGWLPRGELGPLQQLLPKNHLVDGISQHKQPLDRLIRAVDPSGFLYQILQLFDFHVF